MLCWGLPLSPSVVCPFSLAPSLHAPRAHSACVVWSRSAHAVGLDFILPCLIPVVVGIPSAPVTLLPPCQPSAHSTQQTSPGAFGGARGWEKADGC